MPEPIPPFSSATATPHSLPPHWNNKIKPTLLPPPPPFSSNPKPMLGASSNNRLLSLSRNDVVPAPNEPGRKIEIYSLLLHHRYASNSKVSSDHGQFAWFLVRSFLISRRRSPTIHRSGHISSDPAIHWSNHDLQRDLQIGPVLFVLAKKRKEKGEREERDWRNNKIIYTLEYYSILSSLGLHMSTIRLL